jgi:Telomere resolvase
MPQATPRHEIIETYRQRIAQRKHQRLSGQELNDLITGFIETLTHLTSETAIQHQCQTEIKLLEEGYPQTTLATKYLAKYRKAIEHAIATGTLTLTPTNSHQYQHHQRITGIQTTRTQHWALTHLKYTPEIYETLDKRQSQTNRTKQLNLRPVPLERYLQTLQTLLTHQSPLEARTQAIAIAGLTGRRIGEVLARGTFTLTDHPYLLYFEGQQKSQQKHKTPKERPGYNIITLIPATDLLKQIEQFRQHPDIQQISTLEGEPLKTAINQFDVQINRQCDRHLGQTGIVPVLEGKKNVTVHNLRSLWGAIATHLFCPDHYHEYAFLQHYLGHVLDSAATGNYFRYQLTDPQGNLLREKGILLTQIGALPLIEEEPLIKEPLIEEPPEQEHPTPLLDLLSQDPASMTSKAKAQDPAPELTPSNEPDLLQLRTEWQQTLTQKITALRSELETQLETQLTQLRQTSNTDELISRIETLETENATLTQKLKQAQDKLDRFRQLLNGTDTPEIDPQPDPDQIDLTDQTQQSDQPNSNHAIAPDRPSQAKPRGPHPGKAFQRAETIVLAIKDWNRLYPSESFAINAGILETVFRVHRQAVKAFFEAYQNELWDYHQDIGVESPRWHNRGKDPQKLKAFVTQSLEN